MNVSIERMERESNKKSVLHNIDNRIKLIITIGIIIYAVYTQNLFVLLVMEIYLILLILLSKISFSYALKRILLILPFGGAIAIFQPFIKSGAVLYTLPLGITMTYEGTIFGILLLSRLIVCITAIVLLSSVTPMQEIINSARKLGMPREFSMILSLMIRYLFMFYDELLKIRDAQKSRCFDIWSKKTAYLWRLKQIGYTIMMMFLRSYEQGENVYFSMLSRGYSDNSRLYNDNKKLNVKDYTFIAITISLISLLEITRYFSVI
ncbi:MAG: cobalt ECF transporter T component CbiQ [Methanobacterium sp.]|uniref:cobalt ECF transporter T component CbiQ n=1 Tax=Methanobacterium sp. TaxID=2164 RepID=UPI003D656AAB|nr:cobalt ECF transporter T component CbiQ [Methanobacterium sp.]